MAVDVSAGRVVAFLDLGTNSVRLLLARLRPHHYFTIITQQKEVVRLGEGEFDAQRLQPEAMDRAILVCRKFVELARAYNAEEIVAVATAATREAANQAEFLHRLQREAGLDVHVISGREEARLVYAGVASGLSLGDRALVFLDIGGGSTEVIVGDGGAYSYLDSLKLGAIRLTQLYLAGETGPVPPARYAQLRHHVHNAAMRTLQHLQGQRFDLAVASSGTAENLAEVAARRYLKRRRQRDDIFTFAQLQGVIETLCALPLEERRKVPGLNPERADLIIAGAAIFETLMSVLGLPAFTFSDRGLRDGLLEDYLARSEHARLVAELTVRERSILQLGRICTFDEPHARTVSRLAVNLFDSARDIGLHPFGDIERELLSHAALLHDLGAFLSYTNHHAHSYYFIRNAELLGFNQEEVAIIAASAYFHRRTYPKPRHPQFAELDTRPRKVVETLCVLLRIAESLDRSHTGAVQRAVFRPVGKKTLALELTADGDCQLELWGVQHHSAAVEKAFHRKLVIASAYVAEE
jgi:exopolyphosphatase/guanosine-5'-triphosphate,3'-diphosphate pyrophosphatase